MVYGVFDTTSKDGAVTTEDLNLSGSAGSNNTVAQNPGTGHKVGSLANTHET